MGFTRLYLGVHYVSDVVARLIAATGWVAVCVSAADVALRRTNDTITPEPRTIESPPFRASSAIGPGAQIGRVDEDERAE
jgi:membrane-associated phospholipid phosphatase